MTSDFILTEIGSMPSSWPVDRFDKFFNIQQGKQVSKTNRIGDNQRAFLRTSNVFWGKVVTDDLDFMHFSKRSLSMETFQFVKGVI